MNTLFTAYGYVEISTVSPEGPWVLMPNPAASQVKYTVATSVDSARNANGDFIGSVVGSDKLQLGLQYPPLSDDDFARLLLQFDRDRGGKFQVWCRFWDPRAQSRVVKYFYVGDRSGVPNMCDYLGRPNYWSSVTADLVEV